MSFALRCGLLALTEAQFLERIAGAGARVDVPGRIAPIVDTDRVRALVTALAVRNAGGIPLLGDDRWDDEHWAELRRHVAGAVPMPVMAWGTFSSGSTGVPRVILRSEESWAASFPAVTELLGLTDSDVLYLPAPLVSSLTVFSVAHARAIGAGILLPRTHAVADYDLAHATAFHGTPLAFRAVIEGVERGAPHKLRTALVGGAGLDPDLRRRAEAAGMLVVSYYGAAELSFVAVDPDGGGLRPFPGVELRIDDGELWVRSPYLAGGYLGDATGPYRRDADGWGTVGDLLDGDPATGLRFRGRRDGAILTAAATVIPEDVEAALRDIDGIEDAVVFGIPNDTTGSLVGAVIETVRGLPRPKLRELRELAETRLSLSHLPRRWFWMEQLPRTLAGKPARAQIRDSALAGEVSRLD